MSSNGSLRHALATIPIWAPIGLTDEQQLVDVTLESAAPVLDIGANHMVVSLVPLVVAVGHAGIASGEMVFTDRVRGSVMARLTLRSASIAATGDAEVSFLTVQHARHACLPAALRAWQRLRQARWRRQPGFVMSNRSVQQLMLYYLRPRPVMLVSVEDGAQNNLFPMDLIGPLRDRFSLALRTTSPSVATMAASRRVALATPPLALQEVVYALGKHHRVSAIDWKSLPFDLKRSNQFGLRVPAQAQRIRELQIDTAQAIGSHMFFTCRVISDERFGDEPRLHHTCGLHRVYREKLGELPWLELGQADRGRQ